MRSTKSITISHWCIGILLLSFITSPLYTIAQSLKNYSISIKEIECKQYSNLNSSNKVYNKCLVRIDINEADDEYFYRFDEIIVTNHIGETLSVSYNKDLNRYLTGAYFDINNYNPNDTILNFNIKVQIIHRENDIVVHKIPINQSYDTIKIWNDVLKYGFINSEQFQGDLKLSNPKVTLYNSIDSTINSNIIFSKSSLLNYFQIEEDDLSFLLYLESINGKILLTEIWNNDEYRMDIGKADYSNLIIFNLHEPINISNFLHVYMDEVTAPVKNFYLENVIINSNE